MRSSVVRLLVAMLTMLQMSALGGADANGVDGLHPKSITFFRTERDETVIAKNPARYDCFVPPPPVDVRRVCAEKAVAYAIRFDEVAAAVLERVPLLRNGQHVGNYYYVLTLTLTDAGTARFTAFADGNVAKGFDVRVGTRRLTAGLVSRPGPKEVVQIHVREDDGPGLRAVFSSLGSRLHVR